MLLILTTVLRTSGTIETIKSSPFPLSEQTDLAVFEAVTVGKHGELRWTKDLELCADAMYLQITGKRAEEIFPNLMEWAAHHQGELLRAWHQARNMEPLDPIDPLP